ncbi:MAG: type II and III secretion system protein [Ignavibacteriales bacterium]|nr:type II and III secretion system protein [Ignavibacteriales bacterium]
MKMKILFYVTAVLVCSSTVLSQDSRERRIYLKEYVSEQELVSISRTLAFDKAMALFSDYSKRYINKIVVDPSGVKKEIGVDIENMYWLQAFETVLRQNGLWYEEKEEYLQVSGFADSAKAASRLAAAAGAPRVDTVSKTMFLLRDVKISSIFFSVNVVKSLNAGINWSLLYNDSTRGNKFGGSFYGGVQDPAKYEQAQSTSSGASSASTARTPDFVASFAPSIKFSNLTALVSFFQNNQLGDVISSPSLTVSSGQKGRIQVGQDIFITTRDFSGNVVQTPLSTGIIINVTPTVYEEKGIRFVTLDITAERSSASPGPVIDKSTVQTKSILFDGEETVIGGLYTNSESNERGGIPILKDLPWYVLGLRYVFGYDKTTSSKQELIILLRAEIMPSIEDRVADQTRANENLIEKTRKAYDDEIIKRRTKNKD